MSANRKEYRSGSNLVSFHEPVSNASVRGHRQQASDSGVGSDYDSYDGSPDCSAQAAYFELHKSLITLKDDHAKLQDKFRDLEARFKAVQNSVEVLQDDNKKLMGEKRNLKDENQKLRDELQKTRSGRERAEIKMTGALPVQPSSPTKEKVPHRSASKHRRSESKAPTSRSSEEREREERKERKERKKREERDERHERKERDRRVEEDKQRLKGRFEHKETTDDGSVSSSGSSGRKISYIEPYGPSAPRSTTTTTASIPERTRRKRADSSFTSRPQVNLTVAYDGPQVATYLADDGNYYPHSLPETPRGRQC